MLHLVITLVVIGTTTMPTDYFMTAMVTITAMGHITGIDTITTINLIMVTVINATTATEAIGM